MTEPDQAVIARLSSDFSAMAAYLARASVDLRQLERIVAERPVAPAQPVVPTYRQPPAYPPALQPPSPPAPKPPRSDGWIGKALAVAGVAVTLVGVALLLVLAAQAGILRPGFRVFAGAALAAGLVGVATLWIFNKIACTKAESLSAFAPFSPTEPVINCIMVYLGN